MFIDDGLHPEQVKALRRLTAALPLLWHFCARCGNSSCPRCAASIQIGLKNRLMPRSAGPFRMADIDPPSIFVPRFDALAVRWAATGSVASMLHGEICTTRDIDVIILLRSQAIAALERVFPEPEFYCPPRGVRD